MSETITFRNEQLEYSCLWLDDVTFRFEFGDGKFVDSDGDKYFIHCEYLVDKDCFVFEAWFEYDVLNIEVNEGYLTKGEQRGIKEFMKKLMSK